MLTDFARMRYGSERQFVTFCKGSNRPVMFRKNEQIAGLPVTNFLTAGQRRSRICEERRKALEFLWISCPDSITHPFFQRP